MKILLLGGTGAIGSHLANILSERGDKVVVTSRSRNGIIGSTEYRQGNAKDIEFIKKILEEHWDTIVDFMLYTEDEFYERVDILLNSTSKYIFISSARVYDNSNEPITEESKRLLDSCTDSDFLATNEYSLTKARQENMLILSNKNNWVIIRPYITYSEKRLQLGTLEKESWLYRALRGRTIVFSDDMMNHMTTLTYGFDVASGIASIIHNSGSIKEIYNITNEYPCKWSDILNIYLNVLEKRLGYRPKVLYQNLSNFLTWNPGKYQIIYDRLFDRVFDCAKINHLINKKEFTKVQDGLQKCMNDFLDNPEFGYINWKYEAIKDRYTKEFTSLREISGIREKVKYFIYRYFNKRIITFIEKVIT